MRNRLIEATQWGLLRALADGPCTITDLFARIHVSQVNLIAINAFQQLLNEGTVIMRTDCHYVLRGR